MKSLLVPGSLITKKTAPGYYRRLCDTIFIDPITIESSLLLSDIASRIVSAGLMDFEQIESIEIESIIATA